jgi:two-component system, NtrC family, sensor kinase
VTPAGEAPAVEDLRLALRTLEARLRALADDARDMMVTTDLAGRITAVNRSGLDLLGRGEAELLGRPAEDLWTHPPDYQAFMTRVQEQGSVKDFEATIRRADGATIFGLLNATLLRAPDGGVLEVTTTLKDITARILDEQALWKANVELSEANRKLQISQTLLVQREKLAGLGQLAAGIAHEINNPLAFVTSNFSTLRRYLAALVPLARRAAGVDGEAVQALDDLEPLLSECEEGFRRMRVIVQSLSAFSREDPSRPLADFDLNAGIRNTLALAIHEVKYAADVTLALGDIPTVRCRGNELNQVFMNLIVNAAQAIRSQGRPSKGRILISTGADADSVWARFEDDGPGVAPGQRPRVFEPFFTTKPPGEGTGLGLSISREIVERHGGTLTLCEPPSGAGACFTVQVPVSPLAEEEARGG